MRFFILAAAATVLSAVAAQQAYITSPISSTFWKAGSTVTATWQLNATASGSAAPLDLFLFHGDPQHMAQVQMIGTSVAGSSSFKLTVPTALFSDWYALRVGDSWSTYFIIMGTGKT
ncbi:hypothetical protein BGZ83_001253 [Gryganskiella cystojenkinii]|nr:hypothetical protein BGZ83_001253 [Gryganskiella cystojenkinii]